MLARLMAWLREPVTSGRIYPNYTREEAGLPPFGCQVRPLTEGRVNKGGINGPPRITVRPPPPAPMRRSIFPHFDVNLPPPSGCIPQTTMDIPMPAGVQPPRSVCPCCGR